VKVVIATVPNTLAALSCIDLDIAA